MPAPGLPPLLTTTSDESHGHFRRHGPTDELRHEPPASARSLACLRARWREISVPALALLVLGWVAADLLPKADVDLYAHYAHAALVAPLLHAFPKEYPGASLGVFLLPKLLPIPYTAAFSVLMSLVLVAFLVSSDGLPGRPGWSRRVALYLGLGTLAVLLARYDLVPALAGLLAVERARSGRWGRAWAWAMLGTLLKLFPALLLPGFLIAERRRTGRWAWRRILASTGAVAAMAGLQAWRAPGSLVSPFRYELHRGFELESLASSLTLLANPVHASWVFGYGAVETVGAHLGLIGALVDLCALAALVGIWRLAWHGRLGLEATSLAVLTVAVLGEKAFSEQYLIWIIPFWAYWELRRGWLVAAALSTVVYPLLYLEADLAGPSFYFPTAIAGVRNVVLLVTTALWLREQLAEHRSAARADAELKARKLAPRRAVQLGRLDEARQPVLS